MPPSPRSRLLMTSSFLSGREPFEPLSPRESFALPRRMLAASPLLVFVPPRCLFYFPARACERSSQGLRIIGTPWCVLNFWGRDDLKPNPYGLGKRLVRLRVLVPIKPAVVS